MLLLHKRDCVSLYIYTLSKLFGNLLQFIQMHINQYAAEISKLQWMVRSSGVRGRRQGWGVCGGSRGRHLLWRKATRCVGHDISLEVP